MINIFVLLGRAVHHLRGACRCVCEIACIVDDATGVNETIADCINDVDL